MKTLTHRALALLIVGTLLPSFLALAQDDTRPDDQDRADLLQPYDMRQVYQDINTLLHAPHGMDWPDPSVQKATKRAKDHPGAFLRALENRLIFPEDSLLAYAELSVVRNYDGLLHIAGLIGNVEARKLLRNRYVKIVGDMAILNSYWQEYRKSDRKEYYDPAFFRTIRGAVGTALQLHNLTLKLLMDLNDFGVAHIAHSWYDRADEGSKIAIDQFLKEANRSDRGNGPSLSVTGDVKIVFRSDECFPEKLVRADLKQPSDSGEDFHFKLLGTPISQEPKDQLFPYDPSDAEQTELGSCRSFQAPRGTLVYLTAFNTDAQKVALLIDGWNGSDKNSTENRELDQLALFQAAAHYLIDVSWRKASSPNAKFLVLHAESPDGKLALLLSDNQQ